MTPKSAAHDRTDVLKMIELQRGDALGGLNESLYVAARAVLANWEGGDLAAAVRELQTAVNGLDDHHDSAAAIEAGWEHKAGLWMRIAVAGEVIDPVLPNHEIWAFGGLLYHRTGHLQFPDEPLMFEQPGAKAAKNAMKGRFDSRCNRTVCQEPIKGRNWWNIGTRAYYCGRCAALINEWPAKRGEALICFAVTEPMA